jgi:hypothetical protein
MPTGGAISTPSFREGNYSQSQLGKSSLQSVRQMRQDVHEIVVDMMDETDGSQADEIVHFGLDGAEFELNLSKAHAEELRHVLEPYIKAGRKTGGIRNGRCHRKGSIRLGLGRCLGFLRRRSRAPRNTGHAVALQPMKLIITEGIGEFEFWLPFPGFART